MSIIKTALTAGERISSVVGVPWGGRSRLPEADALLLHAYAIYEARTCSSCGRDVEECRDAVNASRYQVDASEVCYATAAVEEWRQRQDQQQDRAAPGAMVRVVHLGEGSGGTSQAELVAALRAAGGEGD